jgi:hypothetical protein
MEDKTEGNDDKKSGYGSEACREQHPSAACSDGDDDEDNFGAFEHGDVEGGSEGDFVPCGVVGAKVTHSRRIFCEGCLLVVERDESSGPKDGFAQPAKAEQKQQRTDDKLDNG